VIACGGGKLKTNQVMLMLLLHCQIKIRFIKDVDIFLPLFFLQ
jgi:hypothetical protein